MAKFPQPSMSRGELSPGLRGRVDIAAYPIGLGKCRGFITRPTGGVIKRPGFRFRGKVTGATRIFPFVYSTSIKYLIEAGNLYFRFWVNGARLTETPKAITGATAANPVVITSNAHGYANGAKVTIEGVRGMTRLNGGVYTVAGVTANTFQLSGVDGTAFAAYASGGTVATVVEVATPYTTADLQDVRITQSADVLYLVHGSRAPRELRRLTTTSFELREFNFRLGPFRLLNGENAVVMAASAATGNVTVTCNAGVFHPGMVGGLAYLEEKELRTVKPWEPLARNVAVGSYRRSDGKVYRATAFAAKPATPGAPYNITGNSRPLHEVGRAWDGPGDIRDDGVNGYSVGVEWEYVHGGFGIVKITGYTSATQVTGVVVQRVPDSCVGTAAVPAVGPWTISGDGVTKTFAVAGATSPTQADYAVTISGAPISQDPYVEPATGGNGTGGGSNVGQNLGDRGNYYLP
jgi:hypothetical protein